MRTENFTFHHDCSVQHQHKPPSNLYFPTTKLTLNCKYFRKAGFVSVISCWAVSLVSILSLSDIFSLISLTTSPVLAPDPPHPFSLYLMSGEVLALSLFLCLLFFLASSFGYLRFCYVLMFRAPLTHLQVEVCREYILNIFSLLSVHCPHCLHESPGSSGLSPGKYEWWDTVRVCWRCPMLPEAGWVTEGLMGAFKVETVHKFSDSFQPGEVNLVKMVCDVSYLKTQSMHFA